MSRITMVVAFIAFVGGASQAQVGLIRNPSFETGQDGRPSGWELTQEPGYWERPGHTGERCISVEGPQAAQSNSWGQGGIAVEPFTTYRFSFWAKASEGAHGGSYVSGPDFCNRDGNVGDSWQRQSHVFVTMPQQRDIFVRVGHWQKVGKLYFDDVAVTPVVPVHRSFEGLVLGDGETTRDGGYKFSAPLSAEGANYSRPLHDFRCGFNTHRWVFGPGAYVVYRHELPGAQQTGGKIKVNIGYYQSGDCVVQASTDGAHYVPVGRVSSQQTVIFDLPAELLPAKVVYVRLRSPGQQEATEDHDPGSFQVHGYEYLAELDRELADHTGSTMYVDVAATDPRVELVADDLGDLLPGRRNTARLKVINKSQAPMQVDVEAGVVSVKDPSIARQVWRRISVPAGGQEPVELDYEVPGAGDFALQLRVKDTQGTTLFQAATQFVVPSLYAADYGYAIGADDACELWWCEGTHKVSRERPAATTRATLPQAVTLSAARNEFEPCQVVLRPTRPLKGLSAQIGDLTGPGDAMLGAENIDVCYVWYHYVQRATDSEGCIGWWPDALPPLDEPIDLKADENQPLWITVRVPKDTPAGTYRGRLELTAEGWRYAVPIRVRVWDFALPQETTVQSGFGLSEGAIARYHNLTDTADKEAVWDLYMQNFRDHRIAPYSFWRRGIDVKFSGFHWNGGDVVEDDVYEGSRCLKITDDADDGSVGVHAAEGINVDPDSEYVLSFAVRTEKPDQRYLVTLQSYDDAGAWISGHNLDLPFTGQQRWQRVTHTFRPGDHSPQARSLMLVLRPAPWTEDGSAVGTAWFDDIGLVKAVQDENLVVDGGFERSAGDIHPTVDFSAWDEYAAKYLDGYRFNAFKLPLAGMGGGTFHSRHYGRIGPFQQGTEGYRRAFKEYCSALEDHLAQKGWLDKAYIYWFDEPNPSDYEFVREGMNEIKLAGPRLRRMLTEEPNEALFGAVDLWCPVLHAYDPDVGQPRQALGEQVWWYVCTGPKAPYPGLFIDHSAVDMRVWLWMSWHWNVEGILIWTTNWWTSSCAFPEPNRPQNPWEDPMGYVAGYGRPPGFIGYWGNGDGRMIYPPNKDILNDRDKYVTGPVNSIRWEMLREGVEDYEYFKLLSDLVRAKGDCPEKELLRVPDGVFTTRTEFSKSPRAMYEHRDLLARAIEKLGRGR